MLKCRKVSAWINACFFYAPFADVSRDYKNNKMSEKDLSFLQKRISELEIENEALRKFKAESWDYCNKAKLEDAKRVILENKERFESLFNGINQPVFVHLLKSEGFNNFIEVNDIACSRYGYSREEFLNISPRDISVLEDSQKKGSSAGRLKLKEEGQAIFEATHVTKEGRKFSVEISSNIYNWLGQDVILSIAIDITHRKQVEDALRESEAKYRHLIENSSEAIYLLYNRHFEIVNKKFSELFGVTLEQTNAKGFDFINLISPESRPMIKERMRLQSAGEELDPKYEFKAINARGQIIVVEATVTPIRYKKGIAIQGIIRDVTEERRFEQQLQQVQKMEAIGTLTGGIAHDFNNLLTVMNGYSELALQEINMEESSILYNMIEKILNTGEKAGNLIRQLLAFSRKQIYQTKIVDMNFIISSMDEMLQRIIGEDIKIKTVLAAEIPKIKADRTQIEQIILNLIVNARDAVYAVSNPEFERRITIETGVVDLDEDYEEKHAGISIGTHVLFSVSDNGIGMNEETRQKIFEPFFTTKEKLKGTGLGLSTVYGIVKQNNGYIYVYSEQGKGTVLKIFWPSTGEKEVTAPTEIVEEDKPTGNETILLVEDDAEVCEFASTVLRDLGYKVYKAPNGKKALSLFRNKEVNFDLLLTDLIMPEMNGKELAAELKKMYPEILVIFSSGYTDNHIVHSGALDEGVNFLQKPYSVQILAQKVRGVLDKG
jgi:PAS domain S-box-containing protein